MPDMQQTAILLQIAFIVTQTLLLLVLVLNVNYAERMDMHVALDCFHKVNYAFQG